MKAMVNFVLNNKLAIWIMTIIMIIAGLYSATEMNKETLPNVDVPYLIVTTVYPGATPEMVDAEIASQIDPKLRSIKEVKNVNSTSNQNFSMIMLEFEYGSDVDSLKNQVQKELDSLTLKEEIQKPSILSIDMNSIPIVSLSINSDKLSPELVTELIEKELSPKLKEVEGINSVNVSGLVQEKAVLSFDAEKLKLFNLTEDQLIKIIQANNVDMSLGLMDFKTSKEAVSIYGSKQSIEDLNELVLPFPIDRSNNAKLSDFAKIELVSDSNSISRVNGSDSFSVNIIKGQGANTVVVAENLKVVIDKFLENNKDVSITYVYDDSIEINKSVETMLSKALFGTLAAIFIIMIFLRDLRSTIISIVSIPLSLLISAFILHQLGVTMNLMSLGAMTVAIGRIIDDSIVVVENIFRRLNDKEEQLHGRALIREATLQMFGPITSSTLVTVAVFLPLMLVGGLVGEIFMPFALTMIFSLLSSLLVAITIVPAMAHTMFKKEIYGLKEINKNHSKPSKMASKYESILNWTLNHKGISLTATLLLVAGSVALIPQLGFGFLAEEETPTISYSYEVQNEETEEDIIKALELAETYLVSNKDVEIVQAVYGSDDPMAALMPGSNGGSITATFESVSKMNAVKDELIEKLSTLDTKGTWVEKDSASMFSNEEVAFSFTGATMQDLEVAIKQVENIYASEKDIKEFSSTLSEVYKENQLYIDEEAVAKSGLTTAQVAMALFANNSETVVTKVTNEKGKVFEVVTRNEQSQTPDSMETMLNKVVAVSPMTNEPVLLKDVVSLEEGSTVSSVVKENGRLVVSISGKIKEGADLTAVNAAILSEINKLDLPTGVEVKTGGTTAQMMDSFAQLGLAMLAAIAIVYLILVLTFREGLAPFAILFSLPMTIIGVVVALFITDMKLDISGMLGILMLIGIVVTNAIVLLDRVIENENKGLDVREALLEGGKVRLRPILMTALATVVALIPLAIGAESGGLISQGLGITVIGGLVSSTFLTLFVVPIVYEGLTRLFNKNRFTERKD